MAVEEDGVQIDDDHVYWLDGVSYPSVTTVLKEVGLVNSDWYAPTGTTRGTAVHEMTELIDQWVLESHHAEEELRGYLQAYETFLSDFKPTWHSREVSFVNPEDGVGGTVDCVGTLGTGDPDESLWVIDIKTGSHERHHGVQLEAYRRGLGLEAKKAILLLKKTGKYSFFTKHKTIGDFNNDGIWERLWLGALGIHFWQNL